MLSFYRSGLLALTLVSGAVADTQADTQVEVQVEVQRMSHQTWVSDVSVERLHDESVLTEYFGESVSQEHRDVVFRVGFIPRFGCSPLITLQLGEGALSGVRSDEDPAYFPNDLSVLAVLIDGQSLSFPTLLDNDGDKVLIYLNASLQRRITTRLRIEVGNQMQYLMQNGKQLTFSLLGSRDAIRVANENCRRHDPTQNQG